MKRVFIAILIALLAASGFAAWRLAPSGQTFYTDASSIKEPTATALVRDVLWEPPVSLSDSVNAGGETYEPKLTNDGLTMYFVRGKAGTNADIYLARRTPQGWSVPEPVVAINSQADDLGPEISADGDSLYFYSNCAGGFGGYDLWVSRRGTDGAWREPANLGPQVNSQFNDYGPALAADGRTLYFSSNRPLPGDDRQPDPNAWPATLREEFFTRTYDLYVVGLTESGPGNARPLTGLNTPANEGAPAVSAFGDFLYFASDRPGGSGGFDLYRARHLRDAFQEAANLGSSVNTAANELDPALSMNGFGLDFSSNRRLAGVSAKAGAEYRLYHTNSREVFSETQYFERAPIDWAALWRIIGPNLLWALLALVLLLLMLLLFKGAQNRKLSLLAKCILASLALHLMLMLLFNVWEVAASLAGEFRRGGPIRVTIAGPTSHAIAAQLTGLLSDVQTPEVHFESRKASTASEPVVPPPSEMRFERRSLEFPALPLLAAQPQDSQPARVEMTTPEPSPAVPATRDAVDLSVPQSQQATAVTESAAQPKPAAQTSPLARQAVAVDSITKQPSAAGPQIVPARAHLLNQKAVSAALSPGSVQDAQSVANSAIAPSPTELPTVPLAKTPVNAPLPVASMAASHSESEPMMPPSPEMTSSSRQSLGSLHEVPAPVAQATESPAPPALRVIPLQESVNLAGGVQVADANPLPSTFKEQSPAPRVERTRQFEQGIRFVLPETQGAQVASTTEQQPSAPTPTGQIRRRADLPWQPESTVASAVRPAFELSRSKIAADSESKTSSAMPTTHDVQPVRTAVALDQPTASPPIEPFPSIELNLPTELKPPENPYPQRSAEDRLEIVKRLGGSEQTEAAVNAALDWLARHQSPDGHWDADGFDSGCGQCGGVTSISADHALTGLAMLCFLGAGHTHMQASPYQDNVQRALEWLLDRQKDDGDLRGGQETMYTQGIATIALAESYAMTADVRLADPVRRAAAFIYRARNPQAGGWRYDPGQAGDTSVLGWQVMALKSATRAGVPVPEAAFAHAGRWFEKVSKASNPGLYGYQPGEEATPSMTAEGLFARQLLGLLPSDPRSVESVAYVLRHLPKWNKDASTYFWYYASLALFQNQGDAWKTWNSAISKELVEHQRQDGRAAGSWDPTDQWSRLGGRVYQTALCTLMLEVYYRYLPMYGADALAAQDTSNESPAEDEIIGTIRGTVVNKATRAPLPGTQIRLVLSDRDTVTATTDGSGQYTLAVPATPDFFALSASLDPYVPQTVSVERARLESKKKLVVNFALEPPSLGARVTEAAPDVHHLGDDKFSGSINSQFQKKSEGSSFSIRFDVPPESLSSSLDHAEVRLLAKGVQRRHKLYINDHLLRKRLDDAPEDGSFGEFVVPFEATLLLAGTNKLRVEALPSEDDIDDFEFVNVRIYLVPPTGPALGAGSTLKLGSGASGTQ